MPKIDVSRRQVLAGAGTGGFGVLVGGMGSASAADTQEYNVGTASPAAERAARNAADRVRRVLDWGGGKKTITLTLPEQAVQNLRKRSDVRYVEENGLMHAISIDSDDSEVPWGVDRVDAEKVHASGETGGDNTDGEGGADIAIIDTGIDDDHSDLADNLATPLDDTSNHKAFVRCRGPNCNYPWSDDNDHGTHCAGIADAVSNSEGVVGVSTEATLHAVKVLDHSGSGSYSDVAAGIRWVADQGYDVGSLSLGGGKSSTVEDAVEYAYGKGVLLVAAAGNDGPCSDCVGYPAAEPEVIAVSATNKNDNLAGYSSTGSEVELAAPGSNIYSTVIGGYDTFSGTSMACPHVSGAGAQLMDNGYPHAEDTSVSNSKPYPESPGGARGQLQDTAEDISLTTDEQGEGLLDVEAALGLAELSVDSLSANEVETSNGDAEFDVSWSVSDPDGDLSSVDLTLTDDTDDETEDTASVDVDGDSASGTTRLVASGDDGSGNSYDVTATVTDAAGNTASKTVSKSESEDTPTVDSLSASEVETSNGDAEFDADWAVSDADGDLSSVDLTLTDDTDDETEDTASVDVDGDSASGTTRLVASGDDGSGNSYTVELVVTDSDGTEGSDTTSVAESEDTSSAPTIDKFALTDDSNPSWTRYYVDWAVSDADGDLSSVTTEMLDSSESVLDSDSSSVSGSDASGTHYVETKGSASDIRLTVTDGAGNSTSDSKSI